MLNPAIDIHGVSKVYSGNVRALSDISLHLEPGVFGLLGPNGAGKTTLLRLLATLMCPTTGRIEFDGIDSQRDRSEYRSHLGYLPQRFGLYSRLTAFEHILYFASLKGMTGAAARTEAERLLDEVGLSSAAGRRVGTLSGGMKQRVGIAGALLGSPRLVVVDEPTAGLDPEERIRLRNLLERVSRDAVVVLSTHIVQDVELGCSRVAVVVDGRVLHDSAPEELVAQVRNRVWIVEIPAGRLDELGSNYVVTSIQGSSDGVVRVRVVGHEAPAHAESVTPQLEDAYMSLLRFGGLQ